MFREGLGEEAEFYGYHPLVNLCYYLFVIGVAMFSNHPIFLFVGLLGACSYSALLKGVDSWKMNLGIVLMMSIFMAVVNGLFTHNGVTVLFYLNGNRITLEAFLYGISMAVLLSSVLIWFESFQVMMCSDKFIYLFGKLAPVLGLTMSMIFRFIPLLQQRFREIHNGQKCMGRNYGSGSWLRKLRQFFKELSILISWSLEASIESADSMEARGYGLRGRSSFHLYRFRKKDGVVMGILLLLGMISVAGCVLGKTTIYYYPNIWIKEADILFYATLVAYLGLMITPMIIDVKGEQRWKQLHLEM